jgi:hypothetical protein
MFRVELSYTRPNGMGYRDERAVVAVDSHRFVSSQILHSLPYNYMSFFLPRLPYNLKMESAGSCETPVPIYQMIWCHIPADHTLLFAVSAPHYAHSFTPLPLRTRRIITAHKKSSNMTFILHNPPLPPWKMDVQM